MTRLLALLLALGPGLAAAAQAAPSPPAPAGPRLVHRHGWACLVYRDTGGTELARCRPEHGTWADARPPMPLAVATAAPPPPTAARPAPTVPEVGPPLKPLAPLPGYETPVFTAANLFVDGGALATYAAQQGSCQDFLCLDYIFGVAGAWMLSSTGVLLLNTDTLTRWVFFDRRRDSAGELGLLTLGTVTVDLGALLYTAPAFMAGDPTRARELGDTGFAITLLGAALVTLDVIVRLSRSGGDAPPPAPGTAPRSAR